MQVTPATTSVRLVTVVMSLARLPSFVPSYRRTVPGLNGSHWLSITATKFDGSFHASGPIVPAAVAGLGEGPGVAGSAAVGCCVTTGVPVGVWLDWAVPHAATVMARTAPMRAIRLVMMAS